MKKRKIYIFKAFASSSFLKGKEGDSGERQLIAEACSQVIKH